MTVTAVVLTAALVLSGAVAVQDQHQHPKPQQSTTGAAGRTGSQPSGMMHADMAERCKAIVAQRDEMAKAMKEGDARLDQLVMKMNSASGNAKVDATAAAVQELVSQRRQMRERMSSMQQNLIGHLGEHMAHGGGSQMAQCPMMQPGTK